MLEIRVSEATRQIGSDNAIGADNQQERPRNVESSETSTRSPLQRKINKTDLAYMAAMLDAEGWISGSIKSGKTRDIPVVTVGICNNDKPLIEWMCATFGGTLYTEYIGMDRNILYEWHCTSAEITPFLKLVIPFLKIKQRQAYLAMAARALVRVEGSKFKRARLVEKIIALNKGRYSPGRVATSGTT